jgi:hypothetical protein
MKTFFIMFFMLLSYSAVANTWLYQVNINNNQGPVKKLNGEKNTFNAGAYYCEVAPVRNEGHTEYRSLTCAVGSGTVSTGGLCTQRGHKFPSVQYAILNLNGPKKLVTVVVSCRFD